MHARFVVIGGGLSGLAAAIRLARFNENVLLLEQHSRVGGLNSYYYRNNRLIETGLHAITNYTDRSQRHAPLNRLLRQLKIKREEIGVHEQVGSAIRFPQCTLRFSNEFEELLEGIQRFFGDQVDGFNRFTAYLEGINPFTSSPFVSTRRVISSYISDPLLVDMLLCPTCFYGSSIENDVDFQQFVILFRSIYQEGLFRPRATIKQFLELLTDRFIGFGGTLRLKATVRRSSPRMAGSSRSSWTTRKPLPAIRWSAPSDLTKPIACSAAALCIRNNGAWPLPNRFLSLTTQFEKRCRMTRLACSSAINFPFDFSVRTVQLIFVAG
ncbi:MAG: FAD-dependent oxidoreductase [Desulfofustis sp.]|nr:FAD-dependent oxidoreductase [Desulfofustis sp.]